MATEISYLTRYLGGKRQALARRLLVGGVGIRMLPTLLVHTDPAFTMRLGHPVPASFLRPWMVIPAAAVYPWPHALLESVAEALGWPTGRESAMEIGRPVRTHIVEPLEDPVPRESPTEPVPEPPREAPAAPRP